MIWLGMFVGGCVERGRHYRVGASGEDIGRGTFC